MPTELWAVAAGVLATLLAALATFELKRGAPETRFALAAFSVSPHVFASIFLYLLSYAFFFLALRGAQLSVLMPVTTLEYVWILLLARRFLHERIGGRKALGIACIALGLVLVGFGG